MNFLLNTFRVWLVRLEAIAVPKPTLLKINRHQATTIYGEIIARNYIVSVSGSYQLKEASVNEAKATPPTIGTREETTQMEGLCLITLKVN